MEAERSFDRAEAIAILPLLRTLLARLSQAQITLRRQARVTQAPPALSSNGSADRVASPVTEVNEVARVMEELDALGVILRDPEAGLIDFPAHRDGRPIYLCWSRGEDTVGWWHPRDSGAAGRQPL